MLHKNPDTHHMVTVTSVADETPTVRTLGYKDDVMSNVLPGQFAMVWVPGVGELPMSVMISDKPGEAAFTVRRHGAASTGLYNIRAGRQIGIRGPYGNAFDVRGRGGDLMMVGGGTGLVPLMRLMRYVSCGDRATATDRDVSSITLVIGAKTAREVFFDDLADRILKDVPHEIHVSTDDGTRGHKGLVTDIVDDLLSSQRFEGVYTCGPEQMMHHTVHAAHARGIFVQASIERVMKCGVGICGSCCMGPSLVCRDGTVFDGDYLVTNTEFGRVFRGKSGVLEHY